MRTLIKWEETMMLALGLFLFAQLGYSWWWFPLLILSPDIGMLGYLFGDRTGALAYNLFHHKGLALAIYLAGSYFSIPLCPLIGTILFSHASLDRAFGYGLKYNNGFRYTHLGEIGKRNE